MYAGELVRLRAYREMDIQRVLEFINDPDVKGSLIPGIPYPLTLENELDWYRTISANKDTYTFAIERIANNEFMGGCGVNRLDWKNSVAELGILLGKPYWSKGYGTDAMKTLVNFCFMELNVNRVQLKVFAFNKRALRSYEKCGFVVEGVIRQGIFRYGQYHDEILMGILREEYQKSL